MEAEPGVEYERERRTAELGRIDSEGRRWCIRGFRRASPRGRASGDARVAAQLGGQLRETAAHHPRRSLSEPALSITYETRLIESSPKRIWGFISPAEATDVAGVQVRRCPATVVEPTSNAMPYAASWKSGQIAVTTDPSWTATVTRQVGSRRKSQ